jgi:hypothetical protein
MVRKNPTECVCVRAYVRAYVRACEYVVFDPKIQKMTGHKPEKG